MYKSINKLTLRQLILTISLFGFSIHTFAQDDSYGIWTSITAEKKIKKWELSSTAELRAINLYSDIKRWSIDADASYSLLKHIDLGFNYKYMYFHDFKYDDFQSRSRFSAYTQGDFKINRFKFSIRELVQTTIKDISDRIKADGSLDTYKMNPEWYWRNRIKIAYNFRHSRFTPGLSAETYFPLNNQDGNKFDEIRYKVSLNYRLSKKQSIEMFGLMGRQLNTTSPNCKYAGGVNYSISF